MALLSRVLSSAIALHWPNTRSACACRSSYATRKGPLHSRLCCCSLLAIWQRPGLDLRQQPTPASRRTSSRAMAATPDPRSWEMVWTFSWVSRVSVGRRTVLHLQQVVWLFWRDYSPLLRQLEAERTLEVLRIRSQSWQRGDYRGSMSASTNPQSSSFSPPPILKSA